MKGHLVRLGVRVTCKELRESMQQVDHVNHQLHLLISLMLFFYVAYNYLITSDQTVEYLIKAYNTGSLVVQSEQ